MREIINEGKILLQKIGTAKNPINLMTKIVTSSKLKHRLDLDQYPASLKARLWAHMNEPLTFFTLFVRENIGMND